MVLKSEISKEEYNKIKFELDNAIAEINRKVVVINQLEGKIRGFERQETSLKTEYELKFKTFDSKITELEQGKQREISHL